MTIIRRSLESAFAVVFALSVAACGLLDTDQPNIIQPNNLDTPEGAEAVRVGAIRAFAFAKDGDGSQASTEGLLVLTGDMSDELQHSGFIPSTVEFDQRLVAANNGSLEDIWHRLHQARSQAEDAAARLQKFAVDPTTNAGIPEMLSLAGYTYIYFAEDFCSGVTYSSIVAGLQVPGPQDSTVGSLRRAIARFDSALASPAISVDPSIQYLAAVGKGRAMLSLAKFDSAAIAVAGVPTSFEYVSEHAAAPLDLANAVFVYGISGTADAAGSISVADSEGANGLPFRSALDPRVPFVDTGHLGLDQTTPQFDITKYPDPSSPVVVADGKEAQLIEAEAALNQGQLPTMSLILNTLRTGDTLGLDTLPTPGSAAEARAQLFSERAFWMYATGHRLGDLRRLVRQYNLTADAVYPTGTYLRGGSYGTRISFPVPASEDQNPHFDRTKCNPDADTP